jgi:hypothetical protein
MSPEVEAVPVLLVEPELSAQLQRLEAFHQAHASIDLTCVATCGGALHALDATRFECVLLPTYLCLYPAEQDDLRSLVRRARGDAVAVLALGGGDAALLGVPVHASVSYLDVALGRLNETLRRARLRAAIERRFVSGITGLAGPAKKVR